MTVTDLHRAIEILAIINMSVIGLSHVMQPVAWVRFFLMLRDKGEPGVFVVAFIHLGIGSIIAALHPVWTGFGAVLTVIAWLWVLKALLYFAVPSLGMKALGRLSEDRPNGFRVAGAIMLVLAGVIAINVV